MAKSESNYQIDRQIVEKILNGDRQAFGVIINNTERLVAQIIFRMVKDVEDRKDIVQDVYLKAYKSLPKFKFQSRITTWIGQITYNTCLNHLEKKKLVLVEKRPEREESNEEALELLSAKFIDSFTNEIEKRIHKRELSEILNYEINQLSPVYRTLISLYHQEELNYHQIVEVTGLPEGTVKNYLFRARKAIKESLLSKFNKDDL